MTDTYDTVADLTPEEIQDIDKDGRGITNAEFEAAWRNRDNQAVFKKVLRMFKNQLDEDCLQSHGMEAFWKALKKHDPAHPSGQKFTTSLYRYTKWALMNEVKKLGGCERRDEASEAGAAGKLAAHEQESIGTPVVARDLLEAALARVPDGVSALLRSHYLEHRPLADIAREQRRSPESVRATLRESLEICRAASGDVADI